MYKVLGQLLSLFAHYVIIMIRKPKIESPPPTPFLYQSAATTDRRDVISCSQPIRQTRTAGYAKAERQSDHVLKI